MLNISVQAQPLLASNIAPHQLAQLEARFPGANLIKQSSMPASAQVGQGQYFELDYADQPTVSVFVPQARNQAIAYARRGEFIVTMVKALRMNAMRKLLLDSRSDLQVVREVSRRGVYLLRSQNQKNLNPWVPPPSLRDQPLIRTIEPNYLLQLNNSQYGIDIPLAQWSINTLGLANDGEVDGDIDGLEALSWLKFSARSLQTVVVAIIDSGVSVTHPGIKAALWVNPRETAGNRHDDDGNGKVDDINGWNFVGNNGNVADNNGHGTHVAGIVGAVQPKSGVSLGLAPNAKLMILKVAEQRDIDTSAVISAVDYAVENSARVINMSLSSPSFSQALSDALINAANHDVFTVAASGNARPGEQKGRDISIPGNESYPCQMSALTICVSATNPDGTRAEYSNYSTSLTGRKLLAAPGTSIWSTLPNTSTGYGEMSGTSMASPHVAAVVAVMRGLSPAFDLYSINRKLLLNTEPELRLNFYRAVTNPDFGDPEDQTSYCNARIEGTPRKWIYPFASSWEPGFDGSTDVRSHRICTLQQLFAINNYLAEPLHYALVEDLDWMNINEPMRTRIGTSAKPFQGFFHGAGHTLRNYTDSQPLNDFGLFSRIGAKGRIENFRMTNARVQAASSVGILAGVVEGVVENVQVEGVVRGNSRVGGIAGLVQHELGAAANTGRISKSFFEGRVIANVSGGGVAGIVGNDAQVDNSFSKGLVTATDNAAGGLVGELSYRAQINSSLSIAKVQAAQVAGGLVGRLRCEAKIRNSFSESNVSGRVAGGLVGRIENASILNTYSTGISSGMQASGGLVGDVLDNGPGPIPSTYACTQTTTKSSPSEILQSYYQSTYNSPGAGGIPKTPFELQQMFTFSGWDFRPDAWAIDPGETPHLPQIPRTRGMRD